MTTINAEQLLRMLAWTPGRFAIGEQYPAIDQQFLFGELEMTQQAWRTAWPVNALYTFSTIAENMYVSSSSALDVGRVIFVSGLDDQFNRISGYGITNGQNQSPVTSLPGAGLLLEFFRINYYIDLTPSLSPGTAAGDIYIAALTTPIDGVPPAVDTRGMIVQGESRITSFVFTVPMGYLLAVRWSLIAQDGEQQANLRIRTRIMSFSNSTLIHLPDVVTSFASIIPGVTELASEPSIFVAPEMTDISLEARGTSPVSGDLTVQSTATIIDYKYVKNLRLGAAEIPIG